MVQAASRYERITEMLDDKKILSVDDFKAIQNDQHSRLAEKYMPVILKSLEAQSNMNDVEKKSLKILQDWDYAMDADKSVKPGIHPTWRGTNETAGSLGAIGGPIGGGSPDHGHDRRMPGRLADPLPRQAARRRERAEPARGEQREPDGLDLPGPLAARRRPAAQPSPTPSTDDAAPRPPGRPPPASPPRASADPSAATTTTACSAAPTRGAPGRGRGSSRPSPSPRPVALQVGEGVRHGQRRPGDHRDRARAPRRRPAASRWRRPRRRRGSSGIPTAYGSHDQRVPFRRRS